MMKSNPYIFIKKFFPFCLSVFIFLAGYSYNTWAHKPEDCIKCHRQGSAESTLHIAVKQFEASVHGREITCKDCHKNIMDKTHQETIGSGSVDCAECHEKENRHDLSSTGEHRPQCYSCHTKHAIFSKDNQNSSVNPKRISNTCKCCHPDECGDTDYLSWFPSIQIASHKKQDFNQAYNKDSCLGCHQGKAAHGEEGPINNQDCYKCHLSQKGKGVLWGYIHTRANLDKQPAIFAVAAIYQFAIVVLLWGGLSFFIRKFSGKKKMRK